MRLSVYPAKERDKAFRREFGALKGERNLLLEKGQLLKARVKEVEGTMKETLEFMDKFQSDLDEANATKVALKTEAKAMKDQVAELQWQVQKFQTKAIEKRATDDRVAKLENELKDTMARGGKIFVKGRDSAKKELIKRFLTEYFPGSIISSLRRMNWSRKRRKGGKMRTTPLSRLLLETMCSL